MNNQTQTPFPTTLDWMKEQAKWRLITLDDGSLWLTNGTDGYNPAVMLEQYKQALDRLAQIIAFGATVLKPASRQWRKAPCVTLNWQ